MNAKYSSVEDTVVSKNHVMSAVQLPNLTSKYQILSGTCTPTAVTAGAVAPLNLLDDNGKQLFLPTGSYIEKIIVSPKTALAPTSVSVFDVQLASRNGSGVYVNSGTSLLSLLNVGAVSAVPVPAQLTNPYVTTTSGTGLAATDSLIPGAAQTGAIINSGVVAFPDVILSSATNNYPVGVVSVGAFTAGEVRVTFFVVCP
jgi:hypothetical protein